MRDPAGLNIRAARTEDAAAIGRVVRDAYRDLPAAHVPADMPAFHPEHHLEKMRDPALRWAVAAQQGVVVGVAMWRMLDALAHLHLLYVAADRQRQGVGVGLLRHFEAAAYAEAPELRLLTLHCMRDSSWALRFYLRHGYTVYSEGDERRVLDLVAWLDACRAYDGASLALKSGKALLYRLAGAGHGHGATR